MKKHQIDRNLKIININLKWVPYGFHHGDNEIIKHGDNEIIKSGNISERKLKPTRNHIYMYVCLSAVVL